MKVVKISSKEWASGLEAASKTYDLFGPVQSKTGYKFKHLNKGKLPDLNFMNTIISPKEFLFPQSEKIFEFSLDTSSNNSTNMKMSEANYQTRAIIGIRPCDAKANMILKMNFETPEVKDPYWLKNYESTTFIGLACDNPCKTCFCTSANSGPYNTEGLDIILFSKQEKNYFAKIITEKGKAFIDQTGWQSILEDSSIFNKQKIKAEESISCSVSSDNLRDMELLTLYKAPFWNHISFPCINCGVCTFTCPTCWCFDIQDEINGKSGVRMKNWDTCMFPVFTVHTTGYNPRETKTQRLRQRFLHKLKYFVDKYENGIMCVGCGRCVRNCPVNIDIRKICQLMNDYKPEDACALQHK